MGYETRYLFVEALPANVQPSKRPHEDRFIEALRPLYARVADDWHWKSPTRRICDAKWYTHEIDIAKVMRETKTYFVKVIGIGEHEWHDIWRKTFRLNDDKVFVVKEEFGGDSHEHEVIDVTPTVGTAVGTAP